MYPLRPCQQDICRKKAHKENHQSKSTLTPPNGCISYSTVFSPPERGPAFRHFACKDGSPARRKMSQGCEQTKEATYHQSGPKWVIFARGLPWATKAPQMSIQASTHTHIDPQHVELIDQRQRTVAGTFQVDLECVKPLQHLRTRERSFEHF